MIKQFMKSFSDQPKPGTNVKVFMKNGDIVKASCTQVYSKNFNGLQWYDNKNGNSLDVNKIKGWLEDI